MSIFFKLQKRISQVNKGLKLGELYMDKLIFEISITSDLAKRTSLERQLKLFKENQSKYHARLQLMYDNQLKFSILGSSTTFFSKNHIEQATMARYAYYKYLIHYYNDQAKAWQAVTKDMKPAEIQAFQRAVSQIRDTLEINALTHLN